MVYTEKTLTCADCGTQFPFTASEQEFYAQKGFANPPKRCKSCRDAAKQARSGGGGESYGGGARSDRQMYDVTCDRCGIQTQVPFKPSGNREVLCRDCFKGARA